VKYFTLENTSGSNSGASSTNSTSSSSTVSASSNAEGVPLTPQLMKEHSFRPPGVSHSLSSAPSGTTSLSGHDSEEKAPSSSSTTSSSKSKQPRVAPSRILAPHPTRWEARDPKREMMMQIRAQTCPPPGTWIPHLHQVTVYEHFEVIVFPLVILFPHNYYEFIR
jgi:hypothetical protein